MVIIPFLCIFRIFTCILFKELIPLFFTLSILFIYFIKILIHIRIYFETFFRIKTEAWLKCSKRFTSKRLSMYSCSSLLLSGTISDYCIYLNEWRSLLIWFSLFYSLSDSFKIVSVLYFYGLESESLHSVYYIFCKCYICASLDRNSVWIIEYNEFWKSECSGKWKCFWWYTFHQTAVST